MSLGGPRKTRPSWFIDETDQAGRENLDPEHVARYDAKEDAEAEAEVAFLERAGLTRNSHVVEFGAGTGQFTVAVASHCARIIAVDPSAPMRQRLQDKVTRLGLENVETASAGFLTYEHAGPAVNFIYSRYALHHLPDFWKALAMTRFRRLLSPGGVFRLWDIVYSFDPAEAEDRIDAWCSTGGGSIEAEWSRAELEEHVRDEHSTFTWILEPMMVRCGFEVLRSDYSDDGIFAKYLLRAA